MSSLIDAFPEDLTSWLAEQGQPSFRARQIKRWLFGGRVSEFSDMTDLPAALRGALAERYRLLSSSVVHHQQAEDGTEKLLVEFGDREAVECVLLRDRDRRTICISSQVGCAMGCVFCASGLDGVKRNLTSGEIVEQMLHLQRLLPDHERLSHIVVMGMGEPLANLDQLLPALRLAHASTGLGISARRITISTVGLPKAIRRLAKLAVPYHLAISLHAPNDELRNRLVPVNASVGLTDILNAADEYFQVSGRRLTFEYVLLGDLNDRPQHAQELAARLRGKNALLNVIPYNPVSGLPYRTPRSEDVTRFCHVLGEAGISVQVRERKGDEIDAACGQLRRDRDGDVLSLDATST